ncbi:zf-CCHC domain-containing protein [Tanacetum coccineum]|uniref:Zf-CCHC domain-containing protein n=1 Tax=Tanacetum coccineum TaxID=301880 RepID=A0ABQ4WU86_9ASTR
MICGKLDKDYDSFVEESIDSGFARFNTIITSLKALVEGFCSKNYVRKFLRALHLKWRAKVTAIEELKDLSSLALDELIGNLEVPEVVMEKDSEINRGKKERVKSIAMKAKKEQPREEKKSFRQRDEKKGKSDRKCFRCGDPNHLIDYCPKPPRNKDQKAFIGGSWSDNKNEAEDKINDETCLEFDSSKASTSRTIPINFVGPSIETSRDGSTIEAHGSTISDSMDPSSSEKVAEHVFNPLMSSRSDFVITKKKLIHNKIEESKKPSLKPSLKSGLGYVKTDSRSKTPPPRRNNSSQ